MRKKGKIIKYLSWVFIYSMMSITMAADLKIASPNNVTAEKPPIVIGMSTDLSGSAKSSGTGMKEGIETYLKKVNATGGIEGRKLELITLDDGFEPNRAGLNVRKLIEQYQALALIGNVGTPNAAVTLPIINQMKVLLFGPRAGSDNLHKIPPDRYVINLRQSYAQEAYSLVTTAITHLGIKPNEFAFFTENDALGDAVYHGAMEALKAVGYNNPESLPYGRYERNTQNVEAALATIIRASKIPPKAILLCGEYEANAKFVKLASMEFPQAIFLITPSLIHAKDLGKEVNEKVYVSQPVPPFETNLPAIHEFLEDFKTYGNGGNPNLIMFEGYLDAKLFVVGLKYAAMKNELTREGIIDAFESMGRVDIGIGIPILLNKNNHTALHQSWHTIFKNGKFVPINF